MGVEPTERNPPYPSSDPSFGSQFLPDQILSLSDTENDIQRFFMDCHLQKVLFFQKHGLWVWSLKDIYIYIYVFFFSLSLRKVSQFCIHFQANLLLCLAFSCKWVSQIYLQAVKRLSLQQLFIESSGSLIVKTFSIWLKGHSFWLKAIV
jgi:hypothetical protein